MHELAYRGSYNTNTNFKKIKSWCNPMPFSFHLDEGQLQTCLTYFLKAIFWLLESKNNFWICLDEKLKEFLTFKNSSKRSHIYPAFLARAPKIYIKTALEGKEIKMRENKERERETIFYKKVERERIGRKNLFLVLTLLKEKNKIKN